MLSEKIRTLGHDPANMQVIAKSEGNNSSLYLVDDTAVIKCVKENVEDHTGGWGIPNECSCSALHKAEVVIESLTNELATARRELEEANSLVSQLREEVALLGNSNTELSRQLDKEHQKSKQFWKQKCDLMLAHKDVLGGKRCHNSCIADPNATCSQDRSNEGTLSMVAWTNDQSNSTWHSPPHRRQSHPVSFPISQND